LRVLVPWVCFMAISVTTLLLRVLPSTFVIPEVATYLGFHGYALITAYVARRETEMVRRLASTNAELRSTQSLLAQSIRSGERLRISREVHDVIGHHLSAQILNLEVALHSKQWEPHVHKAQAIARQLLNEVRDVVRLLRADQPVELRFVLEQMVAE